jgi:hypothetical protein
MEKNNDGMKPMMKPGQSIRTGPIDIWIAVSCTTYDRLDDHQSKEVGVNGLTLKFCVAQYFILAFVLCVPCALYKGQINDSCAAAPGKLCSCTNACANCIIGTHGRPMIAA